MKILVTGAKGMIGSYLVNELLDAGFEVIGVDRVDGESCNEAYQYIMADLANQESFKKIVEETKPDRIIHLAALAHTAGEKNLSWDRYNQINVVCAKNVFDAAGEKPVLFVSTVDVFGFYDGKAPVTGKTETHPVTNYGKSKKLAEEACKELRHYTIFRFSPVYTSEIKRDIQKRYYLKYPKIAYLIGAGTEYEVLSIERAAKAMAAWCSEEPMNDIRILKDPKRLNTAECVYQERREGRAGFVLRFPRWMVNIGYSVLKAMLGETDRTYLLNKAVHPLRSR